MIGNQVHARHRYDVEFRLRRGGELIKVVVWANDADHALKKARLRVSGDVMRGAKVKQRRANRKES